MDDPNVNFKFYEVVVTERNENGQHQLINIRSCGLRTIHRASEKGVWKIRKILKKAYSVFRDSPAKREDYTTKTGSTQFPQYGRFVTNCIE